VSPWGIHFFFGWDSRLYKPAVGKNLGESPGGAAGGGTLTYRRSSPGPGTSYVHGGSPPDLVWVAYAAGATPSTLNKTGRDAPGCSDTRKV
jgi:hypothetical protein